MSYHQNPEEIDPSVAGYEQAHSSSVEPVPTPVSERSPSPRLLQPQLDSPAQAEEDGSTSDTSSSLIARQLSIEGQEEDLEEQAHIELEAQGREAAWRHHPQPISPNPQQQQTPPMIIGAPLGRNLTVLEATSRLVSQWEAIYQSTLQSSPEAASPILEELTEARDVLAALTAEQQQAYPPSLSSFKEETQDPITTPLNSLNAYKSAAVASRIQFLTDSLVDSHFPPERANITAAISLYHTGRIPYSANWALLYAGHLVDFAPNYASFTADRPARLDRYARLYGEGWLWIEPPLAREAGGPNFFSARRGTFVPETDTSYDMGHYSVTMSFRRMKSLVYRGAAVTDISRKRKHDHLAHSSDDDEGILGDEEQWPAQFLDVDSHALDSALCFKSPKIPSSSDHDPGMLSTTRLRSNRPSRHPHMARDHAAPTLHYRLLLDSGATLPMIYDRDARALGICRKTYAAVSRINVETASDGMATWLYEMQVSVVDTQTCEPLVSSTSPVWPAEEHALGGVTLVMTRPSPRLNGIASFSSPCGGMDAVAKTVEGKTMMLEKAKGLVDLAEGRDYGRLSGLLPFKVCYVQATPGLRTMWMGEDRRDVLGAQRMPGQMRWAPGTGRICDPGHPRGLWKTLCSDDDGKPALLRMAHEKAALMDGEEGARMVDVEEKDWKGRSEVLVVDKNGIRKKHVIEPRLLTQQQRNMQQVKKRKTDV
ncbi:uncharacterized protein ColSpa_01819 [Colletotrichum spaethianum]|uniref:Uncharacterized protein n=1 Tax=Colletotrichum spaethianum TaxID=700344 RepID=A0AA37L478_9PEZI|nr:uncharacterized protein ColSpa_01819 [Colletotrichum spaethianum]GKT41638.1 hypothetical protein ColSpa_01819 [Colletotrichum spaethianum]